MKLNNNAIEGGLAGATTLGLITDTLRKVNGNSPHFNLLQKGKLDKRLKKTASKKGMEATRQYVELAGDLISSAAYLGMSALGKKQNVMLRGGMLGTAAGLGDVFLKQKKKNKHGDGTVNGQEEEKLSTKVLKVSLYAIGGLIAGKIMETIEKGGKKKKKRKK